MRALFCCDAYRRCRYVRIKVAQRRRDFLHEKLHRSSELLPRGIRPAGMKQDRTEASDLVMEIQDTLTHGIGAADENVGTCRTDSRN